MQIQPWSIAWSRAKANRILPRECTGHNKHPFPTTQEKTLHMDITRWSTPKPDWLYSLQPKMEKLYTVNKRVRNAILGHTLKNDRMISARFQGKPFNITVIQAYAPTTDAEETEVEWFHYDLHDLLELNPPKDVLFIIGCWKAKIGSQQIAGKWASLAFEYKMK